MKTHLRQQIRLLKKSFTPEQLLKKSEVILEKLEQHPLFRQAETVMLYASLPDEVQTLAFIHHWKEQKRIILPVVDGDDIIPVALTKESAMKEGAFHIWEPTNAPYSEKIDLIVVPGMAFDREGHRLGRGKGYYDRFLAQYPTTPTIGLCFDFQLLPHIPTEPHDIIIHEILSLDNIDVF